MRIGIIGSGHIGSTVGKLWAKAGHQVMFSSRHPEALSGLASQAGSSASIGTVQEAVVFGDVLFLSIPFAALPDLAKDLLPQLEGKIVLETANPYPERDGPMAQEVRDSGRGTGAYLREWFPGVRIVRAFNSVWDRTLAHEAHRAGPRVGIPLASDDEKALPVAAQLVRDAGFDPVIVGNLDRAKDFDVGAKVYNTGMSGLDLRAALGVEAQS
jgi:predicted dinucleotide-binding enzyme